MAIDVLNTGTAAGSGDGESLRSAMTKVNSNFGVAENAASKIVQASSADTTSDKVMLSDYAWRGAQLGDYFTYGGTANAITLTSANLASSGALIAGMKFRFKATASNTGATTITVDGGSTINCVTPTGVALPADFIRTDIITECEYDGANFVVMYARNSEPYSITYEPDGIGLPRDLQNNSGGNILSGAVVTGEKLKDITLTSDGTIATGAALSASHSYMMISTLGLADLRIATFVRVS